MSAVLQPKTKKVNYKRMILLYGCILKKVSEHLFKSRCFFFNVDISFYVSRLLFEQFFFFRNYPIFFSNFRFTGLVVSVIEFSIEVKSNLFLTVLWLLPIIKKEVNKKVNEKDILQNYIE